jgi:hypothetical protein
MRLNRHMNVGEVDINKEDTYLWVGTEAILISSDIRSQVYPNNEPIRGILSIIQDIQQSNLHGVNLSAIQTIRTTNRQRKSAA